MRRTALAIVWTLALVVCAAAEGPIITPTHQLAWDYDATGVNLLEFRMYLGATPSIVPDGTSFVAQISAADRVWIIVAGPGQNYAVVTALIQEGESGPSNEVAFVVAPIPSNLRIEKVPVP